MAGHQRERRKRRGRTWNSQRHDSDGGRDLRLYRQWRRLLNTIGETGLHIFRLHSESRPDGFRFADRDTTLVKIAERGTVRLDFPLVPVDGNGNGNGNGYLNGNGNGNGLNSAGIKRLHGMEAPISLLALAEASADGTKAEGNLALCLKAKLGDEAAVTAAVDLKRVKDDPAVSPEKHYATYGDQSRISNLPFVGPLYLALDYKGLSAMYGQYATGFMTGEFGRYPRTLPGILAKYSGDRFFIVAFDSVTEQVLAREFRDVRAGRSTSGIYR